MLFGLLATFFVIVSLILILLVLVQNDKGGGISGSIGGGMASANTVIGSQNTENILTRGTTLFAVLYFVLTIALSLGVSKLYSGDKSSSGLQKKASSTVQTQGADVSNITVEETPATIPVDAEEPKSTTEEKE